MSTSRVTIHTLRKQKERGEKIVMLTAYDATFARLLDSAGADILLVGDSLGMVVQGHDTTLPVTLDEMIYHCRAVARGTKRAQILGDMPFMSYQSSIEQGLTSAGRLIKEGGCQAIKLEGGAQHAELVHRLVSAGIPVMGHIGLTPQSVHQMGGFKIQGREPGAAERLLDDARTLEQAGAYGLVLEGIPSVIAADITAALTIPTIGIGAGPECDGQVLVIYDLLGMDDSFKPKFVRRYDALGARIRDAVGAFTRDVRAGTFPSTAESFELDPGQPAAVTPLYGSGKSR
ncbi:MAG: 3-methyl-2-oxobutanoate hydroxymethyltransferase [Kofleriaceae bacterium]|jgi:3-methyl-2-oxobutanoate hydroxymethyltransferase|nr:3-methyl-2-oxobutanoate hydroxymethyltransferase [Kofleriaceae bacterium]MBP6841391.1 3-methyl-2-oxobutanoate hydroxymethyltransferase [Kofleriaceae bacterium]MBP9206704.1 3-methyl-2-oxobutanoate hydroxymethyltransferase [Kofleriaceae bacterium]